ncbi:MAG TPA: BON domain-containing protein [Burkholderiales bacterium]|nr:BON domain-containing protein [Burkholderiales bacterium]
MTRTRARALLYPLLAVAFALACPNARADGQTVSLAEWLREGGDPRAFRGSDADGDGRLDGDEIVKARSWDARIKAAEYAGDAWTTAKVKAVLLLNDEVDGPLVSVTTRNGTVTLSGTVRNDEEALAAARLAAQVEGVRKVVNSLTVGRAVAARRP